MSKKSICAVVVTYNRKEKLLECLSALESQSLPVDHIVVIDNASQDGTVDFLRQNNFVNDISFTLITLTSNQGGAGGFYEGIRFAAERHFDYIWLMDDDGMPAPDCLIQLFPYANEKRYIGPLVLDIADPHKLTFTLRLPNSKTVLSTLDDIEQGQFHHIIPDIVMPFNGILFSSQLVSDIGLPHKEFFIWGDDIEYTWRAHREGYEIFTVIDAKFYHPRELTLGTPMFFGLLKFNDTESKLKLYCMCRNNLRNLLDYKGVPISFLFAVKVIWFYLFTKPNLSKLKIGLTGIWHGLKRNFTQHHRFLK